LRFSFLGTGNNQEHLESEARLLTDSGTILGQILVYQKRPMSWYTAIMEQLVSRNVTAFMSDSISQMVKNTYVHGLLESMLFQNRFKQILVHSALAEKVYELLGSTMHYYSEWYTVNGPTHAFYKSDSAL
jgi:hypothetical protein